MNTIFLKYKKILRLRPLILCLCAVLMLCSLHLATQQKQCCVPPSVFGYRAFRVIGTSMEPTFREGSILIVKHIEPAMIQPNDIITYKCDRSSVALTTHRVKKIENLQTEAQFITKGDNNPVLDPNPVLTESLVGRVQWVVSAKPGILTAILPELSMSSVMYAMYLVLLSTYRHYRHQRDVGRLFQ